VQRELSGILRTLILAIGAPLVLADPAQDVEIKLPPGIASETVFIRYRLAGEDLGGWDEPRRGVSSYLIRTAHEGHPARLKALIYAPGCALQTLDVPPSATSHQEYSFTCRPLANVRISGKLIRLDRLYGREVKLRAKYVARWARPFLGLRDNIAVDIPVGDPVDLDVDGHFRMSVPDFSQDPLAGAPNHPGALQIWARDKASEDLVALLLPAGLEAMNRPIGGVRIQPEYSSEIVFAPCSADPPQVHDATGFALRPAPIDACGP
jgi:hypothetical protein